MIRDGTYAGLRTISRPLTKKRQGSISQSALHGVTARPSFNRMRSRQEPDLREFVEFFPGRAASPEQLLWQSVLLEALRCALRGAYVKEHKYRARSAARERLRNEAIGWVGSDEDGFLTVCEFAEVDPSYIRRVFRTLLESDENLDGQRKSIRPRH